MIPLRKDRICKSWKKYEISMKYDSRRIKSVQYSIRKSEEIVEISRRRFEPLKRRCKERKIGKAKL